MSKIIGIDEAGRGPWAGPVVACAVFFRSQSDVSAIRPLLDDSKRMSAKNREKVASMLWELESRGCIAIGIGIRSNRIIDSKGIKEANRRAMQAALKEVLRLTRESEPEKVIIDGNDNYAFPSCPIPVGCLVRGDSQVDEIKAASIIAKTVRDGIMRKADSRYPGYGFAEHRGYGTRKHVEAIRRHGVCPLHRTSFRPIREALSGETFA